MLVMVGYLIIIATVFGGYVLSGGHLLALYQPYEFLIIAGAAFGAFVVANTPKVIRSSFVAGFSIFKQSHFNKKFYIELLSMFFQLTDKIRKDGVLSMEPEVEDYKKSALFGRYPLVVREAALMEFMCDHLRLIVTGRVDHQHLDELMAEEVETMASEGELPIAAINKVADSFPAFGIVAAVMGVVITMQLLGGPPEVLGHHIASALVGTFAGVLIGYGFVGPVASVLENRLHARITIMQSTRVVLIACVHQMAPTIAVEFARKVLYSGERPSSQELEEVLRNVKAGSRQGEPGKEAKAGQPA